MLSMHELTLSMLERMLSLSMTILAKSFDLGQMICLNLEDYHPSLCYSLPLKSSRGQPHFTSPIIIISRLQCNLVL